MYCIKGGVIVKASPGFGDTSFCCSCTVSANVTVKKQEYTVDFKQQSKTVLSEL